MLMNAIVLEKPGSQYTLKMIPVPKPLQNQVLIRVDSSPINPSDIGFLYGQYPSQKVYPQVAGFEGAGVVLTKGPLLGKRVSFYAGDNSGSYADYAVADVILCNPVDDKVSLEVACSSFINPVTVIGFLDIVKKANVQAIVHTAAASQLGRMLNRYFHQNRIQVINIVRRQDQVDILKKEGAEHILNSSDVDFSDKLTELSRRLNATICFDAVGGKLTGQILSALQNKSKIYNYGGLSGEPCQVDAIDLIFKGKNLTGFLFSHWLASNKNNLADCQSQIQKLIGSQLKSDIANEFTLEKFDDGLKFYKANMSLGKTLIRPAFGH